MKNRKQLSKKAILLSVIALTAVVGSIGYSLVHTISFEPEVEEENLLEEYEKVEEPKDPENAEELYDMSLAAEKDGKTVEQTDRHTVYNASSDDLEEAIKGILQEKAISRPHLIEELAEEQITYETIEEEDGYDNYKEIVHPPRFDEEDVIEKVEELESQGIISWNLEALEFAASVKFNNKDVTKAELKESLLATEGGKFTSYEVKYAMDNYNTYMWEKYPDVMSGNIYDN